MRVNPSSKNGLDTDSVAMAFQLVAVDRKFFEEKIGVLEKPLMDELDQTVKTMLAWIPTLGERLNTMTV
jgi:mRNA-degrading endonuclease toxin of MazEF toxin-antitoxin module